MAQTALPATKEVNPMPLVKIKEKYQVTIPSSIRKKLPLKVGDVLEAELEDDAIILKPQVVMDKAKALKRLFAVLKKKRTVSAHDEEVIQDALSAIEEVRRQKHAKSRA